MSKLNDRIKLKWQIILSMQMHCRKANRGHWDEADSDKDRSAEIEKNIKTEKYKKERSRKIQKGEPPTRQMEVPSAKHGGLLFR